MRNCISVFWTNSQNLVKFYVAYDFEKLLAKYELPKNKLGNDFSVPPELFLGKTSLCTMS